MKRESGFTLIEIVMVLVLLGILSAVAVPKYFDLQKQAEVKAAAAIVAEVQARLNGKFASELLNNVACATARTNAIAEANNVTLTNGSISTITAPSSGDTVDVTVTINGTTYATTDGKAASEAGAKKLQIAVPVCGS